MSDSRPPMPGMPANAVAYKRTPTFTQDSTPQGLLGEHATKPHVWGVICVEAGALGYQITEPGHEAEHLLNPRTPGIITPQHTHCVRLVGDVRFHVEFFRASPPEDPLHEAPPATAHHAAKYGTGDATFLAAGGESGIRHLVDTFYDLMERDPAFHAIWVLHRSDTTTMRDKLTRFLCGWMGGPNRYKEKYGQINIPKVHQHLDVGEVQRDQWLACMRAALDRQDYPESLTNYLIEQFRIPAERIRTVSASSGSQTRE